MKFIALSTVALAVVLFGRVSVASPVPACPGCALSGAEETGSSANVKVLEARTILETKATPTALQNEDGSVMLDCKGCSLATTTIDLEQAAQSTPAASPTSDSCPGCVLSSSE